MDSPATKNGQIPEKESIRIYHDEPSYTDHFAQLYDWTWEIPLSLDARGVYAYILYRAGGNPEKKAWPSRKTIAAALGISTRYLHNLLHELERHAMIRIHAFPARDGRPAEYHVQTKAVVLARKVELEAQASQSEQEPPLHGVQEPPLHGVQEPPLHGVQEPLAPQTRAPCTTDKSLLHGVQRNNKDELDTGKQIHNRDTEEIHIPRVREADASLAYVTEDQDHDAGNGHPPNNVVPLTGSTQEHTTNTEDTALKGEKPKRRSSKKARSTGGMEGAQMAFPDSLVHDPVEPDDLWAAKEWLSRVFGWEWVASDTLMQWRRWCKSCVEAGGREMFSRFVATKEGHRWIDEDGQDWRELVGKPWFARQWSAFVNAQRGSTVQSVQGKRSTLRDAGRITDAPPRKAEPTCQCCDRPVGALHDGDCPVVLKGHGPTVEGDHTTWEWMRDNKIRKHRYSVS